MPSGAVRRPVGGAGEHDGGDERLRDRGRAPRFSMARKRSVSIGLSSGGFGSKSVVEVHRGVVHDRLELLEECGGVLVGEEPDVELRGGLGRDDVRLVRALEHGERDRVAEDRVPDEVARDPLARCGDLDRLLDVGEPGALLARCTSTEMSLKNFATPGVTWSGVSYFAILSSAATRRGTGFCLVGRDPWPGTPCTVSCCQKVRFSETLTP